MNSSINELKIAIYNVNYSRQTKNEFVDYHWNNRSENVYKLIDTIDALEMVGKLDHIY